MPSDEQITADDPPATAELAAVTAVRSRNPIRRLYDWVLHWAETPYGPLALFLLAFAESSFFPIPPDVLLIALAIAIPTKSLRYALICSVGSLLGGAFGYMLGFFFTGSVESAFEHFGRMQEYSKVRDLLQQWDVWIVGAAAFTPIPYKIFTLTSGIMRLNFPRFLLISAVGRSARFFIVGGLIMAFGERIRDFIDKYFNLMTILFLVLLLGGFAAIRYHEAIVHFIRGLF